MTEEEILDTGKCRFRVTEDGILKVKCGETKEELTPDQTRLLHGITELAEEYNGKETDPKGDDKTRQDKERTTKGQEAEAKEGA